MLQLHQALACEPLKPLPPKKLKKQQLTKTIAGSKVLNIRERFSKQRRSVESESMPEIDLIKHDGLP